MTICGGVTIGENCVIAAGSVVTRDIPDGYVAMGVPAKAVRKIDENDRINVWETYLKEDIPLSVRDKEKLAKITK